MADGDGSRDDDDLPDARAEPEPDWVDGIRRAREERAKRLRSLLGKAPSSEPQAEDPPAGAEPPPGTPEPTA